MSQIDIELAALLNSLSFEPSFTGGAAPLNVPTTSTTDVQMMTMMNDDDRGYHSDTSDVSAHSTRPMHPASHPCSLMQSFACRHGLSDAVAGHVSDCELSQLIFAHREAFLSCPSAHAGCSAGFGVLASLLEKFAQPTDGGIGMDLVRMLRTEAWLLSGLSA